MKTIVALFVLFNIFVVFGTTIKLNIDTSDITVAGISSGGYMANQLGVAFSSLFKGVAVFAGGPYHCSLGNEQRGEQVCKAGLSPIDVTQLVAQTYEYAKRSAIDPVENMLKQKIWILSGQKDATVVPSVTHALKDYYGFFVLPTSIKTVFDLPAAHAWITGDYGNACDYVGSPFINNCNFDAQKDFLTLFYGQLAPKVDMNSSNILSFPQAPYLPPGVNSVLDASINDVGYMYVPTSCRQGTRCKLLVAIHGCLMSPKMIGTTFVEHSSINGWAEANNIVVLYPETQPNPAINNVKGCWDWWGFTGEDYVTKSAVQMATVYNMVTQIAGIKQAPKIRGGENFF